MGAVIEMLHMISYQVSLSGENHVSLSYSYLLTLLSKEYQIYEVCSSQWKPFMPKTPLITLYSCPVVELLNTTFLWLRGLRISQTWWYCLEPCSNMAQLKETK